MNNGDIDAYTWVNRVIGEQMKRRTRRKLWLHAGLFILTVLSTFFVGLGDGVTGALWYSGGIMTILLTHEMGHFLMARKHGIPASLPYFIPVPLPPFGTMGAVIKMEGRVPDRRALFDVGTAGPLAGLAMIIPAVYVGLRLSSIHQTADLAGTTLPLGDSLLFKLIARAALGPLPQGHDIFLHPLAFAGWVGLLVTAINLIPVGQLDGGHVVYALFGKRSRWVAGVFYAAFFTIFLFFYVGWILPVILLLVIRRHPPTVNDALPLDGLRKVLGWAVMAIFILSFTPVPFGVTDGLVPLIVNILNAG